MITFLVLLLTSFPAVANESLEDLSCLDAITPRVRVTTPEKHFFRIGVGKIDHSLKRTRFDREFTKALAKEGVYVVGRHGSQQYDAISTEEIVDRIAKDESNQRYKLTFKKLERPAYAVPLSERVREALARRPREQRITIALICKTQSNHQAEIDNLLEATPLQVRVTDRFSNVLWVEGTVEDLGLMLKLPHRQVERVEFVGDAYDLSPAAVVSQVELTLETRTLAIDNVRVSATDSRIIEVWLKNEKARAVARELFPNGLFKGFQISIR